MEGIAGLHIEKLPGGVYLATSDDVQGLVAQGRTTNGKVEIPQDVAPRLIEVQKQRHGCVDSTKPETFSSDRFRRISAYRRPRSDVPTLSISTARLDEVARRRNRSKPFAAWHTLAIASN